MARPLQPLLHELSVAVRAPGMVMSSPDAQIRPRGVQGLWIDDRRALSRLEVSVDGHTPEAIGGGAIGPSRTRHFAVCRTIGDLVPDPTVRLERSRQVAAAGMAERLRFVSSAQTDVHATVTLSVASDAADISTVKGGRATHELTGTATGAGWHAASDGMAVTIDCEPQPDRIDAGAGTLSWDVVLAHSTAWDLHVTVDVELDHQRAFQAGGVGALPWEPPHVTGPDPRIGELFTRGFDDLATLLLADGGEEFLAAGAPWFLTMFGRDSLWAARMLLPFGTDLARSTLTALARRQGTRLAPTTEEEPGKILHEVRPGTFDVDDLHLPPVYYGTIDATPLWIVLLVDMWRWGGEVEAILPLLPNLRAALAWITASLESSPRGLLEYVDHAGTGLANQGWKDSGDSVQFADGRLADAPIALVEPQAYAFEALTGAADLLDALGQDGADALRIEASHLAERVRDHFWVHDGGPYLAIALDHSGTPVDSVTSNAGHVLGTGLLDTDEAEVVARRMVDPRLVTRYGLRTLTTASPRFGLLSYHGGTVWPHDTAVVATGLAREGHLADATTLARGLVEAAPWFGYRLPELYGVTVDHEVPVAYPAACRPQAWSAAAPISAVVAALGLVADAPNGTCTVPAAVDPRLAGLVVDAVRVGDSRIRLEVGPQGGLTATVLNGTIEVQVRA